MPDMLAGLEEPARAEAAEALTHFLVSVRGAKEAKPVGQSAAAINLGRSLYHTVGCVQCHAPDGTCPPGKPGAKEELAELAKTAVLLGQPRAEIHGFRTRGFPPATR